MFYTGNTVTLLRMTSVYLCLSKIINLKLISQRSLKSFSATKSFCGKTFTKEMCRMTQTFDLLMGLYNRGDE